MCALPIASVMETMRPLPVQRLENAPALVLGLAMVRGVPTPVIDTARLLGAENAGAVGRFITLAIGTRVVALAVATVWGVRSVTPQSMQAMPPLLTQAEGHAVAAIGALDQELLVLLQGARLIPAAILTAAHTSAVAEVNAR